MDKIAVTIEQDEHDMRIDRLLADRMGVEYSRTFVRAMIDKGLVKLNGREVKPSTKVDEGDIVEYFVPPPGKTNVKPEGISIQVIYEDDDIIVVDKPAGMIVHPGAGNKTGTLANALVYKFEKLKVVGDILRPGIVHRLDKETSGVIVAVKNEKALRSLARQFQKKSVKKRYIAVVKGNVESDNGMVDAPITRHKNDRKKMTIDFEGGKPARTVYHVAKRYGRFTVLKVEPETGRTHQIRVHMKYIGHPVVGDKVYGWAEGFSRHALHADLIGFTHPVSGEYVEFRSPVPDDIMELLKKG